MNRKNTVLAICLVLALASILTVPVIASPTSAMPRATPISPVEDWNMPCQITTCAAGTGLKRNSTSLSVTPTYRLPQDRSIGHTGEWDGFSWAVVAAQRQTPTITGASVAEKSSASFIVQAMGGETCSVTFDYRIVAKRLGYEDMHLEPIKAPQPSRWERSPFDLSRLKDVREESAETKTQGRKRK